MMPAEEEAMSPRTTLADFATTRWSVVRQAGKTGADGDAALATLCELYWRPVYCFVRRRGGSSEEARDLTQGFFADFLERGDVRKADHARGRFRSYLLACVQHFVADRQRRERAIKRGGAVRFVSLEAAELLEPATREDDPERAFHRAFALATLEAAFAEVREAYRIAGEEGRFDRLRPVLCFDPDAGSYARIGAELGLAEGAVKVAVHRLRQRFQRTLRALILQTVCSPTEVDAEIAELFTALAVPPPPT
jgi:RNA polymerase sigma-70 factor (ECF subfamily)